MSRTQRRREDLIPGQRSSPFGEDDECATGVAPAEETFADQALDGPLGHALLVDVLRLPEERWTADVPPQCRQRERENLWICHRLSALLREEPRKRVVARILKSFYVAGKRGVWSRRRPARIKKARDTRPIRVRSPLIYNHSNPESERCDRFRSFVGHDRFFRLSCSP